MIHERQKKSYINVSSSCQEFYKGLQPWFPPVHPPATQTTRFDLTEFCKGMRQYVFWQQTLQKLLFKGNYVKCNLISVDGSLAGLFLDCASGSEVEKKKERTSDTKIHFWTIFTMWLCPAVSWNT